MQATVMAQHHALRVLIEMTPGAARRLQIEGPLIADMWLLEPLTDASIERLRAAWARLLPATPPG
jgi:hypothetical protein